MCTHCRFIADTSLGKLSLSPEDHMLTAKKGIAVSNFCSLSVTMKSKFSFLYHIKLKAISELNSQELVCSVLQYPIVIEI